MFELGLALMLCGLGIAVAGALAIRNPIVERRGPWAALALGAFISAGGLLSLFAQDHSTLRADTQPRPVSSPSEGASTVSPFGDIRDLNPAPQLNQSVRVGGTAKQGHAYLLTPDGCEGSEMRAESHVYPNSTNLRFEAFLTDDAPPTARVKIRIEQAGQIVTQEDLDAVHPVTVNTDLVGGDYSLTISSLGGTEVGCQSSEFTVVIQNFVLSEG